ncbi:hypothetical protein AGMMS49545_11590 [Betaproteobacteria bacterium]|nr:hypothetical protein AGMMS49545_11590 [Betaproteobacteria bacterium]GHU45903.1 hypothetical protein AGMMS50289_18060 [Betaproteobacteria bacterium]
MRQVIEQRGLPCAFYSDRGSHYWTTPEAGGKVDKSNLTRFGRAMRHLGIEMIAACSPEARGRSERAFATHQGRHPKELALLGITTIEAANRDLRETCLPRFNAEFAVPAREEGSVFVPWIGGNTLEDILCEQYERTVSADNCVRFEGRAPGRLLWAKEVGGLRSGGQAHAGIGKGSLSVRRAPLRGREIVSGLRPPTISLPRNKKRTIPKLQNRSILKIRDNRNASAPDA